MTDAPQLRCWTCGGWFTAPKAGVDLYGGMWVFEGGVTFPAAHCRRCARQHLGLPDTPAPPPVADNDMTPLPRTRRGRKPQPTKGEGF